MLNIAVMVSGGGTNLQALIDAQARGELPSGRLALVVSSKEGAYALARAEQAGIPTVVIPRKAYNSQEAFDRAILDAWKEARIDLVVLAGYLSILSPGVTRSYENRIINVHPSLIPSFCGAGFYGLRVHQAALDYGVKVTGATVHIVNEIPDGGRILLQKAVEIREGDTPETLQKRVMEEAEWKLLPQAAELCCQTLEPLYR
ncbi:MAG: phosphoribosylglycinamide formyltransferase [Angelakisella sp.]|nr:phosphoribosylglycinamide formyltransferase [Angelakisella sp.]